MKRSGSEDPRRKFGRHVRLDPGNELRDLSRTERGLTLKPVFQFFVGHGLTILRLPATSTAWSTQIVVPGFTYSSGTQKLESSTIMNTLNLTIRPEFFRLPTRGVDPYFGLSRSFYYNLDVTGQVRLVRLRTRGSQKGVTLVSYDAMSAFLARASLHPSAMDSVTTAVPSSPPTPAAGNVHQLVQQHSEDVELMRKLSPTLLHDLLRRISDLEEMVRAAPYRT